MLPKHNTGQEGWGPRDPVSCVFMCHPNCFNFVLNSGPQPRAPFTYGKFLLGPPVPFPASWAIVRVRSIYFYPSALEAGVLWSLSYQKGSFGNGLASFPGPSVPGLYRQRGGEEKPWLEPRKNSLFLPFSGQGLTQVAFTKSAPR